MRVSLRRVLLLVLLTLFLADAPLAQSGGEIRGRVADQNQGIVPQATILLTDFATRRRERASSDAMGEYRLRLPPGRYRLQATKEGFQPIDRVIEVGEQPLTLDLTMEPATVGEVIDIVADAGGLTAAKLDVPLRDLPISPQYDRRRSAPIPGAERPGDRLAQCQQCQLLCGVWSL